jgi:glycine hydroxymethyltransferase
MSKVPKIAGNTPLKEHDPELFDIIECEKARQFRGLELIASENFTSQAVFDCLGSCLANKYSEGEIGHRYYGGNEFIDKVEALAKKRALEAFNLDPAVWGVNVQPYSGSPANFAVLTALLKPHDRFMGLHLPCGGHLTHGFYTPKKKISATSIFFEPFPYKTDENGIIDYAGMEEIADTFRPAMIILGSSAYPRDYEYDRVRALCDKLGCYMFMDMAHSAGLIAAGIMKSPFDTADVVTTTTHKTLRGPRSGVIYFRKVGRDGKPTDYESRINMAVFPGLQGGPHQNEIAGVATQFKEVCSPAFKEYAQQVQTNARVLAKYLMDKGYTIISGGTDNHLVLWNLKPQGVSGAVYERVLELVSISSNKNTVPGDKSALNPGGVRLGTPTLTTRGLKEKDFEKVGEFLHRANELSQQLVKAAGSDKVKDVDPFAAKSPEIQALRDEVQAFAATFPMPGFDVETMKYPDHVPAH